VVKNLKSVVDNKMKKILIISCLLLFGLIGCTKEPSYKSTPQGAEYYTIIVDSCEYLRFYSHSGYTGESFTHKGNCKFCAERQNKRDEEFLKILKGR